jgi:hypothetical protein
MRTRAIAVTLLFVAAPLAAQSPVQVALFAPIQIVPQTKPVKGLRIDFIYGANTTMTGLDLGLVNRNTGTGHSGGFQWGLVNMNHGSFTGWQASFVGVTEGKFEGLQSGFVNLAHESEGLQWGGVNSSWSHHGLQLAIVNYARHINGVQVGLVNIIAQGGQFPVFPIVNWGKSK